MSQKKYLFKGCNTAFMDFIYMVSIFDNFLANFE